VKFRQFLVTVAAGAVLVAVAWVVAVRWGGPSSLPPDPSPRPGAEALSEGDDEADRMPLDFDPLLALLRERDYDAAYAWLATRARADWPGEAFARHIGRIRDEIGDGWAPERFRYATAVAPRGRACSARYRLAPDLDPAYRLHVVAVDAGRGYKIKEWHMSRPCKADEEGVAAALTEAEKVRVLVEQAQFDDLRQIMTPRLRERMTAPDMRLLRSELEAGAEVDTAGCTERISNGAWHHVVKLRPAGRSDKAIEVLFRQDAEGIQIVGFVIARAAAGL